VTNPGRAASVARVESDPTAYSRADWTDFGHVGLETLAGRYLRRFWQPVYRAQDLREGRAVPVKILNEDFTLYRGQDGAAHALAFRCAHRGTQLSTGWVEGDNLRCFYHGWVYGPDGQCVEQPAEPEPFCQRIKIRSYPVQEYLGLIFVYFGEGEAPALPRYPEFEGPGIIEVSLHRRMCGFFNNLENSCDEAHISFTHRNAFDDYVESIPEISGEETAYGIVRYGHRPGDKLRIAHIHMPNMQQLGGAPRGEGSGWRGSVAWRVPVDDESHIIPHVTRMQLTAAAEEQYHRRRSLASAAPIDVAEFGASVLRGEARIEDLADRRSLVPIQDEVTQVGQGRIADRTNEHLGQSDAVIVLLRSIWARELRSLAEGRPLKHWRRSAELELPSDE